MKKNLLLIYALLGYMYGYSTDVNWTFIEKNQNNEYFAAGYGNTTGSIGMYCMKFNSSGNILWQKEVGGVDFENTYCSSTDGNNFYVGGTTNSYGFGAPGDGYIAKLDANGNLLWDNVLGEINTEEVRGIVAIGASVFAVGNTNSFSINKDVFITKHNSTDGSVTNSKILYTSANVFEEALYFTQLSDGNLLLIADNGASILLIKLDSNLNILFSKELSNADDIQGTFITEDLNNNLIVTGFSNFFNNTKDLVIKLNSSGNIIWSKYVDWGGDSKSTNVKSNNSGYFITGYNNNVPSTKFQSTAFSLDDSGNLKFAKAIDNTNYNGTRIRRIEIANNNVYKVYGIGHTSNFGEWNIEAISFSENSNDCFILDLTPQVTNANVQSNDIAITADSETFFEFAGGNISNINQFSIMECEQSVFSFFELIADPCNPSIQLNNLSTNGVSYNWDFGDTNNSTQTNPNHTYSSAGTYTITLTANDGNGNTDWWSEQVVINPLPTAIIIGLPPSTSNINPISLNATPAGGTFSGTGVIFNAFNPSVAGVGQHNITYTYTDSNGCAYTDEVSILVFNVSYNFVNYNLGTITP